MAILTTTATSRPDLDPVATALSNDPVRQNLLNCARIHARRYDQAEDLVSDAIVIALKSTHKYDPQRASVTTWVCKIIVNLARKRVRKIDRNLAYSYQDVEGLLAQGPSPVDHAAANSVHHKLNHAMAKLNPQVRDLVYGRYYDDLKYEVLADRHNISKVNARVKVNRAIGELRLMMSGEDLS